MNKQHKIAFIIAIISMVLLDACFIMARIGYITLFDSSFKFYQLSNIDVWYHVGLILIFVCYILLLNGDKK